MILIEPLAIRCWLAAGSGHAAQRRGERRQARDRLLSLVRQTKWAGA
jgi:hypothetical protein